MAEPATAALRAALVAARKAQAKDRVLVLGTVLAAVQSRELDAGRPLTEADVLEVLRKGVKLRRDAEEQYRAAGREDLAGAEKAQIAVIEEFLPAMVGADEIRAAVRLAIEAGAGDLGRIMGQVMPRFRGRADGKLINQIAREELGSG